MKFFMFIFAIFGTVEIIISGEPTRPLRNLLAKSKIGGTFVHCALCLGFWAGMFWGHFILPKILSPWYLAVLAHACMGSGCAYLLHGFMPPFFDDGES